MEIIDQAQAEGFALALVAALLVKHFIADFVLQSKFILDNRHTYGHPGGLLHAGIHAIGTLLVLWLFSVDVTLALILAAAEGVIHYHIDWIKDRFGRRHALASSDKAFWISLGFDQLLHHLTYVAIVLVVLRNV